MYMCTCISISGYVCICVRIDVASVELWRIGPSPSLLTPSSFLPSLSFSSLFSPLRFPSYLLFFLFCILYDVDARRHLPKEVIAYDSWITNIALCLPRVSAFVCLAACFEFERSCYCVKGYFIYPFAW